MFRSLGRLALVCVGLVFVIPDTSAHDSWISRGGHRNAAGEWCCGEGDCFVVPSEQVTMTGDSYILFAADRIPFTEAHPSPDGAYWPVHPPRPPPPSSFP